MSLNILTSTRLSRRNVDIHTVREEHPVCNLYFPPDGRRSHSIHDGDIVILRGEESEVSPLGNQNSHYPTFIRGRVSK
jgi:hypothetical protein